MAITFITFPSHFLCSLLHLLFETAAPRTLTPEIPCNCHYLAPYLTNLTVPEILASKRIHSREYHRAKSLIVPFQGTERFGLGWAIEENTGAAIAKKNPNPLHFHHTILFAAILLCHLVKNNISTKKERERKQFQFLFPQKLKTV